MTTHMNTNTRAQPPWQVMFWDVRLDKLMKKGNKRVEEADLVWKPMHVVHLLSSAGAWGAFMSSVRVCAGLEWSLASAWHQSCIFTKPATSQNTATQLSTFAPNMQATTLLAAASALIRTAWTAPTSLLVVWRGSCWRGTSTDHRATTTQV